MIYTFFTKKDRAELFAFINQRLNQPQSGYAQAAAPRTLIYDDQYFHVTLSVAKNWSHITLSN